jgi:hypothetical protein
MKTQNHRRRVDYFLYERDVVGRGGRERRGSGVDNRPFCCFLGGNNSYRITHKTETTSIMETDAASALGLPPAKIVEAQTRMLESIRSQYNACQRSPQQRRQAEQDASATLLADMEEKYRQGKIELEALNNWKQLTVELRKIMERVPVEEPRVNEKVVWSFLHSEYGNITISDDGWRNWRPATTEDVGAIVLFSDSLGAFEEFGEMDDIEQEPDEEFPDEMHDVATVYTQGGQRQTGSAHQGHFEELRIVPDAVLQGVRDEAPPGKFFSGKSVNGSQTWTPSPEGMVWYDHPFLSGGDPQYFTDLEYFVVKRRVELFGFNSDLQSEYILWLTSGRFEFWCPVLKKFMPEGEMLRQEHWFHNGDGSAQQRYYYTQNEMLDRHGGLANLATGARLDRNNVIVYSWTEDDESADVANVRVRTATQVVDEKFREAERSGKMINLE